MNRPAIKALFFDFVDVCAVSDFSRFIKNFSKAAKVPALDVELALRVDPSEPGGCWGYTRPFAEFECGTLSPGKFFHVLTAFLDCRERIDFDTFARLWVDIFTGENIPLDQLLHRLPQEKYLLSNTNNLVYGRYVADCQIIRNHFPLDRRILSHVVHAIKPDPSIYYVALRRANVAPQEALFVDDRQENITAWRALGGHGIVYHAVKNSIEELEAELRAFGVLA